MAGATGGVRVSGLNKVTRALLELGLDVADLKDAFADIADEGAKLAAGFAPQVSGRLASDVRGNRAKNKAVITAGRASVPYAGVINYGWPARNITASGFMQRADEALQPTALKRLERSINHQITIRGLR